MSRVANELRAVLTEYPSDKDWDEVKRRALVTVGKKPITKPTPEWKHNILKARHSPIRYLRFSFDIDCPYYVSNHLARHVHSQPYIQSQRNDRQDKYDRDSARQDASVRMIWDMNAEELIAIAEKRLCGKADQTTRGLVQSMVQQVLHACPEFTGLLVPRCIRYGVCDEMQPCGLR